ncbi:MAG: serine/threonine protein kinase [Deltaproteobacteria bacterium]|nr:serine/threonine protein kinase [Deltaproteobacteria bacterium]
MSSDTEDALDILPPREDREDAVARAVGALAPPPGAIASAMASVQARMFGAPTRIGRYLLLDELGRGGMGVVHRAYDPELDRRVAIKLVSADGGEDGTARLKREAQALARVSHRHVVSVFDVGSTTVSGSACVYIVMELIEGRTLGEWLVAHEGRVDAIVRMFVMVSRGLAAAHGEGIVHRDFKPANVVVDADGEPHVLDFGLASAVEWDAATHGRSQPEHVFGTPPFMSPEQLTGGSVDARTDQYALAVALYHGLGGGYPFALRPVTAMLAAKRAGVFAPPYQGCPPHLFAALVRAMHPDPSLRFPSIDAWISALEHDAPARRRRVRIGLLGLAIVGAGLIGASQWHARRVAECEDRGTSTLAPWSDDTRELVRRRFVDAAPSHGAQAFDLVDAEVEGGLRSIGEARRATCMATVAGQLGEREAELRDQCLTRLRAEIGGLISVLGNADATAANSRALVVSVEATTCLRETPEVWADNGGPTPEALAEARGRIDALTQLGRYDEALAEIDRQVPALDPVDVASRVRLMLARASVLRHRGGDADAAEVAFAALKLADAEGLQTLATDAMARLADALADVGTVDPDRLTEADRWLVLAEGRIDAEDTPTWLRDFVIAERVDLLRAIGDPAAVAAAHRLLDLRQRRFGDAHPSTASAHDSLGAALFVAGRREEGLAELELALAAREEALGHWHPSVARSLNNVAVAYPASRADAAQELLGRALEIDERCGSIDTIYGLERLLLLVGYARSNGRIDDAVAHATMASELLETVEVSPALEVRIHATVGGALLDAGDPNGAVDHFARAVEVARATNSADAAALAEALDGWTRASWPGAPLRVSSSSPGAGD